MARVPKMALGRIPWHAAFTAVLNYLFLLPDHRLYIVNSMYISPYLIAYRLYMNYRC